MMDAVSGLFLDALGTDMTAMEEYFPFVTKAFTIMQVYRIGCPFFDNGVVAIPGVWRTAYRDREPVDIVSKE